MLGEGFEVLETEEDVAWDSDVPDVDEAEDDEDAVAETASQHDGERAVKHPVLVGS